MITYDGSNWFPMGNGINGVGLSILRYNGELLIAGAFDSSGTIPFKAPIAKWDGSSWVPLDTINYFDDKFSSPTLVPDIQDLCIHNNSLYLCGNFWSGLIYTIRMAIQISQDIMVVILKVYYSIILK
ncbi:MAG: hypothetical protein IPM91_04705 [Bacteroidetes bacterium]|nr:hypothetical protein [Bacteroidota bacterium]